jgi:hypothetical protein
LGDAGADPGQHRGRAEQLDRLGGAQQRLRSVAVEAADARDVDDSDPHAGLGDADEQAHVPPNDGRWWFGVFIIGFGLFLLFVPMMGRAGVFFMVLMVLMGLFTIDLGVLSMRMSDEFDAAPIQRQVVVMLAHHIHEQQGTKGIVATA